MGYNSYYLDFIPSHKMYYSEDTRFGVYKVLLNKEIRGITKKQPITGKDADFQHEATVAGIMPELQLNMFYEGHLAEASSKYGKQFKPEFIRMKTVDGQEKTKRYLISIVPQKTAEKVAGKYPNLISDVMKGNEVNLTAISGIGKRMASKIIDNIKENYMLVDILAILSPLGITKRMIDKIVGFDKNPEKVKQMLTENPYELTKINGLGFKKVDELALKLNPKIEVSKFRIKAFIEYTIKEYSNNQGHTLIDKTVIDSEISKGLPECYSLYLEYMKEEKVRQEFLKFMDKGIGSIRQYDTEKEIYDKLRTLDEKTTYWVFNKETKNIVKEQVPKGMIRDVDLSEAIKITNEKNGFELTQEQISAVENVIHNDVAIISGAAGTGKSSVIECVLNFYSGRKITMCALAAKAAQRMTEITGRTAETLHRTLEFGGDGFGRTEARPISADIVIIDEGSMVNSWLWKSFVRAIAPGTKLVIVFDYAQLPPIGAANIASDLLKSDFAITKFTKVHRQAEKSGILMDATAIRNALTPVDYQVAEINRKRITHGELQDMHYFFKNSAEAVNKLLINSFMAAISTNNIDDVYIVLPRKKGVLNSTEKVNLQIQDKLINRNVNKIVSGEKEIREGARIIQRRNNYDKEVVNGEIGIMKEINYMEKAFVVQFPNDKIVDYNFDEVGEIELAYALTVHSFQGSQSKIIIIGLDTSHFIMLDKFLLYTAITRAQKTCMIVAMPAAFKTCIQNSQEKVRVTFLQQIIKSGYVEEKVDIKSQPMLPEDCYSKEELDNFVDINVEEI